METKFGDKVSSPFYGFGNQWIRGGLFSMLLLIPWSILFSRVTSQIEQKVSSISHEKFDSIETKFTDQNYGNLLIGDYDNDNDHDLLFTSEFWDLIPDVLIENQRDTFRKVDISIVDVFGKGRGQAWGDIDNDNDLDLVITGMGSENRPVSKIYKNDGGGNFTDMQTAIEGISESAAAFGDLDNDGDQDLVLSGLRIDGHPIAKIYYNLGQGNFVEFNGYLEGLSSGSILICDLDGDLDNDIVLNGYSDNRKSKTIIFRNENHKVFNSMEGLLPDIGWGMWRIADFNRDGLMDLIAADAASEFLVASIQKKDFTFQNFQLLHLDSENTRLDLNDFDLDGDVDIAVSSGAVLENISIGEPGIKLQILQEYPDAKPFGDVSWVNWYDDDSNELVFSSSIPSGALIYKGNIADSQPAIPMSLSAETYDKTTVLSWQKLSNDPESNNGLSYNLRVGTTPGGCEVVSPMSDSSGFHKVRELGNCTMNTSWKLDHLPPGEYYWSVQAIDQSHHGSFFAEEQSFKIDYDYTLIDFNGDSIDGDSAGRYKFLTPVDFDNDEDYDFFCTAEFDNEDGSFRRVGGYLRNQGDTSYVFENMNFLVNGSHVLDVALSDYNNDGYVDIALSQVLEIDSSSSHYFFLIIKNLSGKQFIKNRPKIMDMSGASIHWIDYDRDGDADLCLVGTGPDSLHKIQLYKNESEDSFSFLQELDLTGLSNIRTEIHDFESDGKMDMLLLADSTDKSNGVNLEPVVKFFKSDSTGWSESSSFKIPSMNGSMDVSDFNNDGFMDVIEYGSSNMYDYGLNIFHNNGGQTLIKADFNLEGVNESGFVSWGDNNLDDLADVYIFREDPYTFDYEFQVYEQDGSAFERRTFYIDSQMAFDSLMRNRSFNLVDMDGDFDLDIIPAGENNVGLPSSFFLKNIQINPSYTIPIPKNLRHTQTEQGVLLEWDQFEGRSHYYNIRVGTSPGGMDVVSPMSDPETGFLRIPITGNAECNNHFTMDFLADGSYYWSVQGISKNMVGGPWSEENSFGISTLINIDFEVNGSCSGESISFTNASIGPVSNWFWSFGDGNVSESKDPLYTYSEPGVYEVSLSSEHHGVQYVHRKTINVWKGIKVDFSYEQVEVERDVPFKNLTDTLGIGAISWKWDFDDDSFFTGFDPGSHYFSSQKQYMVSLTAIAANGCADSITKEVPMCYELLEKPVIFIGGPIVWYLVCSDTTAGKYKWYYNGVYIPGSDTAIYMPGDKMGEYYVAISKYGSCFVKSDVVSIPDFPAGRLDKDGFGQVEIYPNPAKGVVTLEMDNSSMGELLIEIYAGQGRKVYRELRHKQLFHFSTQIELNGLLPGIYLITIRSGIDQMSRKLLIE